MTSAARYFAIVPAAGVGRRMGADCPKQYLSLANKTVLEHSLGKLLAVTQLEQIIVPVAAADSRWRHLAIFNAPRIKTVAGGGERCDSVLNGLKALAASADERDWVLVHDVARPCIRLEDIERLISQLAADPVGGILAVPVSDTIKQAEELQPGAGHCIVRTVDRSQLWQAQTPQLFRYGALREALESALAAAVTITDEASALEWAGQQPKLVEGARDNIKITRPEDLALAEYFLQV